MHTEPPVPPLPGRDPDPEPTLPPVPPDPPYPGKPIDDPPPSIIAVRQRGARWHNAC